MKWLFEFRLLPVLLAATAGLFVLKTHSLITAGGYTLGSPRPAMAEDARGPARSWAQDMIGYPEITGSVSKPAEKETAAPKTESGKTAAVPPAAIKVAPEGKQIPVEGQLSPAERAILERLQARRQELDQRARELDIREDLIGSAEKRLEARAAELKDLEARINTALSKKSETEIARLKGLVTMYETMKAKEAAKIFDRLDLKVLAEVAGLIAPRRMSDILAQMSPDAAERLTIEFANRAHAIEKIPSAADLPKIEGRPAADRLSRH